MFFTTQSAADDEEVLVDSSGLPTETTWYALVKQQVESGTWECQTCKIYSTDTDNTDGRVIRCVCGRLVHQNCYIDVPETKFQDSPRWKSDTAVELNATVYGQLDNGTRVCYNLRSASHIVVCVSCSSLFDVIHSHLVRWMHSLYLSLRIRKLLLSCLLVALVGREVSLWQIVWKESLRVVLAN